MSNPWARGAAIAGIAAASALAVARDVRACGAEAYEATIVVPSEGNPAMPRDGVLVAGLHALEGAEPKVVLLAADGTEIAIAVDIRVDESGFDGLLVAPPMVELDASASPWRTVARTPRAAARRRRPIRRSTT